MGKNYFYLITPSPHQPLTNNHQLTTNNQQPTTIIPPSQTPNHGIIPSYM
ncbi:MAG: hypothetical protein QNJ63_01615 [Calothrix sp. MO_192.B10]|nr:hypothetical protein [Calothrix sp. MO_192.B10]